MAVQPDLVAALVAAGVGVVAGIASGLFGIGGGVVAVPALIYLSQATFHEAKAAALMVILAGGTVALLRHHSAGAVRWRHGLLLLCGGVVGSYLSSVWAEDVSDTLLGRAFGLTLILVAARLVLKDPKPREHAHLMWTLPIIGFAGGIMTGFFGIGGGVVMVPGMVLLGLAIHQAVATSLVAVVVNGAVAGATQLGIGYGPVMLTLGVPVALGALVGGLIGAPLALAASARWLKGAFAGFLALVGATFLL